MNKLLGILLIIYSFFIGFVRDFIFQNVNGQLYFAIRQKENPYLSSSLNFLQTWDFWPLYFLKYFLTLLFFLLFLLVSLLTIKLWFNDAAYLKTVHKIFWIVFFSALSILGLGMLIGQSENAYTISRFMMGWVQSPFALFVLMAAYPLFKSAKIEA